MIIKIDGSSISSLAISSFQITGGWNSLYTKGRILLNVNSYIAKEIVAGPGIFIGSDVEIILEDETVFFKILAFNFLQAQEDLSKTSADLLELILISPWYLDNPLKNTSYYGNSSEIIKGILKETTRIDSFTVEEMMDPHRRRYQLGTTDFDFIEKLRPYLTTKKSPGFLYNNIFGKVANLKTFDTMVSQENIYVINAAASDIKGEQSTVTLSNSKFYYNENKQINDIYALSEITTELQKTEVEHLKKRVHEPISMEILSNLSEGYVRAISYERWDLSPLEQYAIAQRAGYVAEIEFNAAILITEGLNIGFDIGNKIKLNLNKPDEFRNKILSNEYVIKGLTFSYDSEEEESYTKMVAIPLIELD